MKNKLPLYTKEQLAARNQQPEVWVAYKGIIYDVSASRFWKDGFHHEHLAGRDLTDEFGKAPHESDVFSHFRKVGRLK